MGSIIEAYRKQCLDELELIQELWAGYGKIYRLSKNGKSFILKHYQIPENPAGLEAKQKMKWESFLHELDFYRSGGYATIRTPQFMEAQVLEGEIVLLLEDLSTAGYNCDSRPLSEGEFYATIDFLAKLHASTISAGNDCAWAGYWTLERRQEEWSRMSESKLKKKAGVIDQKLKSAHFRCLLHGDAKPANYGFNPRTGSIAAFDFQYWGRGIGPMDLACYFSGVLDKESDWDKGFECYLEALRKELKIAGKQSSEIEQEWRELWPYCVADYFRFLQGWMPDHHKLSVLPRNIIAKVC